ncbi:MAG: GyrI-like domain-containing protein [Pirellulales bacterium]
MPYDIRLETRHAPRPLAVVRRTVVAGQLAQIVPAACGLVWSVVRSQNLAGAGRHVALYGHDGIHVEIGVELDGPFAGHGEVVPGALPAGTIATTTHFGPYDRLGDAHRALREWCAREGQTLVGPNWELYGHWDASWNTDPKKIRTDVAYLVKASDSIH